MPYLLQSCGRRLGTMYVREEHAKHLDTILWEHYEIEEDWSGSKYIGLSLDWDYDKRQVHLLMPAYLSKALQKIKHEPPRRTQNSPYPFVPPKYRATIQYADAPDESPPLDKEAKKYGRSVGILSLYYFFCPFTKLKDFAVVTPLFVH